MNENNNNKKQLILNSGDAAISIKEKIINILGSKIM